MFRLLAAASLAACLASPAAAALLPNGDFSAGFDGWTVGLTENGATDLTDIVEFPTVEGEFSAAAAFQVGRAGSSGSGGVLLSRAISIAAAGEFEFSADIASLSQNTTNGSGGVFRLLVNGIQLARHSFGIISGFGTVERARLAGTIALDVGDVALVAVEIVRPFIFSEVSPQQFVDNVSTTAVLAEAGEAAVPLPAAAPLLLAGLGGVAVLRRGSKPA